jgi:glucose-6-phosphate 1-dehydrogenase
MLIDTDPTDIDSALIEPLRPTVIVLFGATGDLARRKLIPGLFHLSQTGLVPELRVVGTSLDELDDGGFRALAAASLKEFSRHEWTGDQFATFTDELTYVAGARGAEGLADGVARAVADLGGNANLLHYLSVPPSAAASVIGELERAGLTKGARIIMENPFGTDLVSEVQLNYTLHESFDESQIFRIDHFLGKEAVLNILAFRFANGLFEPIWNRDHIDHVQIDVPESLGLEMRGAFYEPTGAYRDMVVTHLFQILAFMAMEPPTKLESHSINEEKNKVFRSLRPLDPHHVVRGQYHGYRDEPGVDPLSETETFVALRCEIDNWRWAGVPFFLRTGKYLAEGARIISIAFREPPQSMFPSGSGIGAQGPDHLTFDLADASKLSLSFYGKRPGRGLTLDKLSMQFALHETGREQDVLEAYERLIHDARTGDHTLFTSSAGIERLWDVSTPLLAAPPPVRPYAKGSWGPNAMHQLIAPHTWRLPFERGWRNNGR